MLTYDFLRVKKLLFFESSFCDEAGKVCDLDGPEESASVARVLIRAIQLFMSVSSCAWNKKTAPFSNLKEIKLIFEKRKTRDLKTKQ